jgi:hypothetical protein
MRIDRSKPEDARYIRRAELLDNGRFIVHCQFEAQSRVLHSSPVIYIDKTFKRTACNELEFNGYDGATQRITTLARVYTDMESSEAYEYAISLVFRLAEEDVGEPLKFAHLIPIGHRAGHRIRAILIDMHGGQAKGLLKYFQNRFPIGNEMDHLTSIVKVCRVHYTRSIAGDNGKSLKTKDVESRMIPTALERIQRSTMYMLTSYTCRYSTPACQPPKYRRQGYHREHINQPTRKCIAWLTARQLAEA